MQVLHSTRKILTICGFSPPSTWTSLRLKILYNAYTFLVTFLLYSCTISLVLDLLCKVENQDELTENLFMMPSMFLTSLKLSSMLVNRSTVRSLIDALQKGFFRPVNDEEMEIRMKFERKIEKISLAYAIPIEILLIAVLIPSFFFNLKNMKLTLRGWLPYDFSSSYLIFYFTYFHQLFAIIMVTNVSIAYDNFLNALFINIHSQLEILDHRLRNIKRNENYAVKQCARHHDYIYKYASKLNNAFRVMMPLQFSVTLIMICFTLYRLSQMKVDAQFVSFSALMLCTFTQILYYTWNGNEAKLKSTRICTSVFQSNWMSLDKNSRTILLTIMTRAMVPIEFTSAGVLSMDLESFKGLVKAGYSAFNVLRQTNGVE